MKRPRLLFLSHFFQRFATLEGGLKEKAAKKGYKMCIAERFPSTSLRKKKNQPKSTVPSLVVAHLIFSCTLNGFCTKTTEKGPSEGPGPSFLLFHDFLQ